MLQSIFILLPSKVAKQHKNKVYLELAFKGGCKDKCALLRRYEVVGAEGQNAILC